MSARPYGKIHGSFWTSPTIRACGDDGRTLAAYLLTSPHTTMLGCFRAPDAYVSEDIGWPAERVRAAFDVLHRNGFATRDQASWVVVHRFLFWNPIDNQNQGKAAMKAFAQLPESAKPSVARGLAQFGDWVRQDVLRPFLENRSGTVPNPEAGSGSGSETETETEPEIATSSLAVRPESTSQEQLALLPVDPPSKPDVPRQVFDAYLEARAAKRGGGHAPVLSDKRRALVKARLKDHPVEQLVAAARGIWASDFHVNKGFAEFDMAMRDAEHVERFAALVAPPTPAPRPPEPEDTETREQRLEKARAYGRRIIERPEGTGAGW